MEVTISPNTDHEYFEELEINFCLLYEIPERRPDACIICI